MEHAATPTRPRGGYLLSPRVLFDLARTEGVSGDAVSRDTLMRYYTHIEVHRLNGLRSRATQKTTGRPGPESSIGKLAISLLAHESRDLSLRLLGPGGMLAGDEAPSAGHVQQVALSSPGAAIGGGTDEMQRSVIAEQNLGLPRDPASVDDIPFDQTAHNARRPEQRSP